jgi:hypothetical protein
MAKRRCKPTLQGTTATSVSHAAPLGCPAEREFVRDWEKLARRE